MSEISIAIPVASFNKNWEGSLPIARGIEFTDTSKNNPISWDWDFGDGSPHATAQNIAHKYLKRGLFTVILTVSNSSGSSSATTQVRVV